jgi:hypothetical protein
MLRNLTKRRRRAGIWGLQKLNRLVCVAHAPQRDHGTIRELAAAQQLAGSAGDAHVSQAPAARECDHAVQGAAHEVQQVQAVARRQRREHWWPLRPRVLLQPLAHLHHTQPLR